jgi:hypothetical protein
MTKRKNSCDSGFLLDVGNDIWTVVGSFFCFSHKDLCGTFPFVSQAFRVRAREHWSKFAHPDVFNVWVNKDDNLTWVSNHHRFIRKMNSSVKIPIGFYPKLVSLRSFSMEQEFSNYPALRKLSCDMLRPQPTQYPQVRRLSLGTGFRSDNLEELAYFPQLEHLFLQNCQIGSLAGLRHCPNVRYLWIYCTSLSSLKGLECLTQLQALGICYSFDFEAGSKTANCEYFGKHFKNLKFLYLGGTNTSGFYNSPLNIPYLSSDEWIFQAKLDWKRSKSLLKSI